MLLDKDYRKETADEIKIQLGRWDLGLLNGIDNEYVKGQMALLLENQRLWNEADGGDNIQFQRIGVPLVRRAFDPAVFLGWDLANVQVMLSPEWAAFFDQNEQGEEPLVALTQKRETRWILPCREDIRKMHSLNEESAQIANTAGELADEFNKEIITDLYNNVGQTESVKWTNAKALWASLQGLFFNFEKEIAGRQPNWLATSPKVAAILKQAHFEGRKSNKLKFAHTGVFNKKTKLIECKEVVGDDILVGYKGAAYESGYCWAPYVPFMKTPIFFDMENFMPWVAILTRGGKRLAEEGTRYYAKLTIEGLQ